MRALSKKTVAIAVVAMVAAIAVAAALMFRNRLPPPTAPEELPPGEPEKYSASVVRVIEDGVNRDEIITRFSRSGDMKREEWGDAGMRRAMIWRPDLGKYFLLAIDRQEYVEADLVPATGGGRQPVASEPSGDERGDSRGAGEVAAPDPQVIDRAVGDAPSPVELDVRLLPDQMIGNHLCGVTERRATFADGHVETTRTFRARDLSGLGLRVESYSTASAVKVTTERRDVRTEVPDEEFTVPSNFKKVARLTGER